MMRTRQLFTPPSDLVKNWACSAPVRYTKGEVYYERFIADRAATWGAQKQRELIGMHGGASLKKQALSALYAIATGADSTKEFYEDIDTIRLALESLPG